MNESERLPEKKDPLTAEPSQNPEQFAEHSSSNHKKRGILWCVLLFGILGAFLTGSMLNRSTWSAAERRKLAKMPEFSWKTLSSGRYQNGVETYMTDHLAWRDPLLKLNASAASLVYGAPDQNGFVMKDGHIIEVERAISHDSLAYAASLFEKIWNNDLKDTRCKVYFSIVPDKSYFLEHNEYLNMDYAQFFEEAKDIFSFGTEVPITQTLSLSDYYCTDPHWRQESLLDTAKTIASSMHVTLLDDWDEQTLADSFQGQQAFLSGWIHDRDAMKVLWNEQMKDWTVTRYDQSTPYVSEVYDLSKVNGPDPYSVFLSGSAGMITIENPHAEKGREMILFADSYGSSIAPLLASGYSKTTIIDLRNLPSYRLNKVIDFTDQDVLFLYSTSVLNASETLK